MIRGEAVWNRRRTGIDCANALYAGRFGTRMPDGSPASPGLFPDISRWRRGIGFESDAENGQWPDTGRSDSTLNRGGVRMGTSKFQSLMRS